MSCNQDDLNQDFMNYARKLENLSVDYKYMTVTLNKAIDALEAEFKTLKFEVKELQEDINDMCGTLDMQGNTLYNIENAINRIKEKQEETF